MVQYIDSVVDWLAARSDLQLAGMGVVVLAVGRAVLAHYSWKRVVWGQIAKEGPMRVGLFHRHVWVMQAHKNGLSADYRGAVRSCGCGRVQRLTATGRNHVEKCWVDNEEYEAAVRAASHLTS